MADEEYDSYDEELEDIELPEDLAGVGRTHTRWTLVTGLLDLASNLSADLADFFALQGKAASQHAVKKMQLNILHEEVGRQIETLPTTQDEEEDE